MKKRILEPIVSEDMNGFPLGVRGYTRESVKDALEYIRAFCNMQGANTRPISQILVEIGADK